MLRSVWFWGRNKEIGISNTSVFRKKKYIKSEQCEIANLHFLMSSTREKWVAISCQTRILSLANSSALGASFPSQWLMGPRVKGWKERWPPEWQDFTNITSLRIQTEGTLLCSAATASEIMLGSPSTSSHNKHIQEIEKLQEEVTKVIRGVTLLPLWERDKTWSTGQ